MKNRFRYSKGNDFLVNLILLKRNFKFFLGRLIAILFVCFCFLFILKKKNDIKEYFTFFKKITSNTILFKKNNIIISNDKNKDSFLDRQEVISVLFKDKDAISVKDLDNLYNINLINKYNYKINNNILLLTILEKKIIGKIIINNVNYLMDIQNNIIKSHADSNKLSNLITIVDFEDNFDYAKIYDLLEKFAIKDSIFKVRFFPNKRCNIYFKNNIIVKLPYQNTEDAMERLLLLNKKFDIFNKRNIIVDLKISNKAFIQKINQNSIEEFKIN